MISDELLEMISDGHVIVEHHIAVAMAGELRRYRAKEQPAVEETERAKNQAYTERDQLVAAISKCFPSHLCRHPDSDIEWEDDWRWIVCIHLPTGQATWHIHESELPWFSHLERKSNHWDGHSTEEKYRRLAALL